MPSIEEYYKQYFQDWDSLSDFHEAFEWYIPETFNAGSFLCDRWADGRGRTALYYNDLTTGSEGTYTFEELSNETNRLANQLEATGLSPGDRIAINVSRKRESLFTYLAAWKAGVVPVPLSTLFGPDSLGYRLNDSGAQIGIVDASNLEAYREAIEDNSQIEQTIVVGDVETNAEEAHFWEFLEAGDPNYEPVELDAEDDLILMYTSGTTGEPKGVRHVHRAVIGHLPGVMTCSLNLAVHDEDIFWTPVEFSWAGTLTAIVGAWAFGIPLVAFESGEPFDAERAFSIIERYEVTACSIPPSGLRMMMMQVEDPTKQYDIDQVRILVSGGESLGESVRSWAANVFEAPIHEAYGQTELWNLIAGDCSALFEPRSGSFGRALPGHDLEIIDPETAEPLKSGKVGEIALQRDAPTVLKDFWNKPEQTNAKFSKDWVLTGDLGKRDEDGRFEFVSRKDDVIISSGYRIGPVEVEDSVTSHEAVADAGVIGIPDDERGKVPKAFVVLVRGYQPREELKKEIQQHVRNRLADYEYPRHIEFIDELPRTTTGKVRRADLRKQEGVDK